MKDKEKFKLCLFIVTLCLHLLIFSMLYSFLPNGTSSLIDIYHLDIGILVVSYVTSCFALDYL